MLKKSVREKQLTKILLLIQRHPSIRPRVLNSILGIEHSASMRNTLIKRGLVRKLRKGSAVHYYPIKR